MYNAYFNLTEKPFTITPDPRFLYLSERHSEGLSHLLYGMGEAGGFVQLTGEIGTGKTILYRSVLEHLPEGVDVALILNPKQSASELIAAICDELRVIYPQGSHTLKALNRHLLNAHARGRRTVLIIDEAQNLDPDVLEQIRLLTNLETDKQKLLQIILVGQPELKTLLAKPELRQLAQRITARYDLTPLDATDTSAYVRHRLHQAGTDRPLFTTGALRTLYKLSEGYPRVINNICDRALIAAYAEQQEQVDASLLKKAAAELKGEANSVKSNVFAWASGILAMILLLILAGYFLPQFRTTQNPPTATLTPEEPNKTQAITRLEPSSTQAEITDKAALKTGIIELIDSDNNQVNKDAGNTSVALKELINSGKITNDTTTAFTALFKQWKLDYTSLPSSKTACKRATTAGLDCIFGRGNWNNLKLYNRPAVLELIGDQGLRHHVTLIGLNETTATISIGGKPTSVPLNEFDSLWYGAYILLWRPPELSAPLLRLGQQGNDITWLRTRLNQYEGNHLIDGTSASTYFDTDLKQRLMAFQRQHNLPADGVVGRQTMVLLNSAGAPKDIPLLSHLSEKGQL